jgi:predicted DNA-binding transcriptional regulator AlpA
MAVDAEAYLAPNAGAEFLGVSLSYFYRRVLPAVPVVRFGRSVRIRRSDLVAFATAHETRPAHELATAAGEAS